jgi:hypothetical protein
MHHLINKKENKKNKEDKDNLKRKESNNYKDKTEDGK